LLDLAGDVHIALFADLSFAHRARCAAAILRRTEADIILLTGFGLA
jgi:hypothetical protein